MNGLGLERLILINYSVSVLELFLVMLRLSSAGLVRAHRFLLEIHAAGDVQRLRHIVPDGLRRLIPGDRASFNEIEISGEGKSIIPTPVPAWWSRFSDVYSEHILDHPLWNRQCAPQLNRAITLSDGRYSREWKKSPLHNEYFLPLGMKHQLSVLVHKKGSQSVGIAVNRSGSDFTAEDRALLNLLSPHISQALGNALRLEGTRQRSRVPTADGTSDEAIITVCPETGRVRALSAGADRMLQHYFGTDAQGKGRLPHEVHCWLRAQQAMWTEFAAPSSSPYVICSGREKLTARIAQERPGEVILLLERSEATRVPQINAKPLTRREREILHWIREGKRNSEIGVILGLSTRTIGKHVEHIFQKLGVETRTAAARAVVGAGEAMHA